MKMIAANPAARRRRIDTARMAFDRT